MKIVDDYDIQKVISRAELLFNRKVNHSEKVQLIWLATVYGVDEVIIVMTTEAYRVFIFRDEQADNTSEFFSALQDNLFSRFRNLADDDIDLVAKIQAMYEKKD